MKYPINMRTAFLLIMLSFSLSGWMPVFALEGPETGGAMVSRENSNFFTRNFDDWQGVPANSNFLISREDLNFTNNFVVKAKTYESEGVLVGGKKHLLDGNFVVREETYRYNGALVGRQNPIDLKILDILKANKIESIEDYAQWLPKNLEYKRDKGPDRWSSPLETLKKGYGDCEDYAFLNAAILHVLGYQPKVIAIERFKRVMGRLIASHAICAFEKDGRYLFFDNAELKATDAPSMREFSKCIFTRYDCFCISELAFDTGSRNILFKKSSITNDIGGNCL